MERYDLFDRPENKNFDPNNIRVATMVAPAGLGIQQVLTLARQRGIVGKGSARSGVFQVQCDRGIWGQVSDRRMEFATAAKAAKVTWVSWEDMD
jgi:hypothetical protein